METMKEFYNEKDKTFKYEPNSKEFWENILNKKKVRENLTGHVVAINYNGLIVEYDGFRMYMPTQYISLKKSLSFEQYLDKDIEFKIVKVDPANQNITISHRDVELEEMEKARKEELSKINVGEIYSGTVKAVKEYGAFIEIKEGIQGLCHISELSLNRVKKINAVIKTGDKVDVKVIKVEDGKISLSIKALQKPEKKEEVKSSNKNFDPRKMKQFTGEATTSLSDLLKNIEI